MTKLNIIKNKKTFLSIAIVLVVISLAAIGGFGFKQGIDFTSGSLWQLKMPGVQKEEVLDFFEEDLGLKISSISYEANDEVYSLTFREIEDVERQEYLSLIKEEFGEEAEENDFWSVSPSVSDEIKTKALYAIVFVFVGISFYVAFAFRKVSKPVSSWKYSLVTLITLFHDVAIAAGTFAILGYYLGINIDTNFVVALLVVMGFSVNDTIVVFDRIRENLTKEKSTTKSARHFDKIINDSVNETIKRSINTSATLLLVLISLFFIGPPDLKYFILTMLVGTIAGTYSSIFIASPLLTLFNRKR